MEYTNKTTLTSQENCTPCNRRNISYHMMKYSHVTRKTSCDRKYTSCDKRSICHRRIFSCEINNISCDRKFISCDRNKKEHLVSQYTFPVNERIFTVTGNEYPVTGRTKNTRIWIFVSNVQMGRGHQYIDPLTVYFCPVLFLVPTLRWLLSWWWRDFSRCFGRNYLLFFFWNNTNIVTWI